MRSVMSQYVSIVRSDQGLAAASEALAEIKKELEKLDKAMSHPESMRLRQAIMLAQLTVLAASQRHESRGLHYSIDWPEHQATSAPSQLTLDSLRLAGLPH